MLAVNLANLVREVLFLLFADLTALVAAVIGPTYDNLLVPELAPQALYPSVYATTPGPANFLAPAASFSTYLVANVVDPLVALLAVGVAVLYLARATLARWAATFDGLLPRLVLAVVAANFTVPIAAAVLSVPAALYPVVSGWDGGAWGRWAHLAGYGEIGYSWDNGVLAFVLSLVQFALVFALVLTVGLRDALLAVLLVLLPILTLLWPFRPTSSVPRRAWLLFGELAFLPCALVVPLELAVGCPNPVLLVGYLGVALASPFLLGAAGAHLVAIGFPSGGSVVQNAAVRGLGAAPAAAAATASPAAGVLREAGGAGRAAAGAVRAAGSASAPLAVPFALHDLLGHGALGLARHVGARRLPNHGPPRVPPFPATSQGGDGRR